MKSRDFRDLIVWQKSMDLAEEIHQLIKTLPYEERYALSDQMRRCAISIPSNIAEGQRRNSIKDFTRFLYISKGSTAELQTQLLLCQRFGYTALSTVNSLYAKLEEIDKMLYHLIQKLSES